MLRFFFSMPSCVQLNMLALLILKVHTVHDPRCTNTSRPTEVTNGDKASSVSNPVRRDARGRCFCGNADDNHDRHGESVCHMPCAGSSKAICGAQWAMSIFRI